MKGGGTLAGGGEGSGALAGGNGEGRGTLAGDGEVRDRVLTKQIGHDVIAYHHGDGQQEPEWCFKDVLHDEICLGAEHEHGEMSPGKLWREGGREERERVVRGAGLGWESNVTM